MLGAHVRTFANYTTPHERGKKDITRQRETDPSLLVCAAKNMRNLTKLSPTKSPLAVQVITDLPLYPQLSDLTIDGINPNLHIWQNAPTAVRKLKWKIISSSIQSDDKSAWENIQSFLEVLEASCPNLEELDIS